MTYYFDCDGVLADFHKPYFAMTKAERKISCTYEFIRTLEPFQQNIELVKRLIAEGHDVYVSTKVANLDTRMARIEWLMEYIPELAENHIIAVLRGNKSEHMRTETGILIDDREDNCAEWVKAGHTAIHVQRGEAPIL